MAKSATRRRDPIALESAPVATPELFEPKPIIVPLVDPEGASAEAIRALRTRIQSQHLRSGRRALAICGPTPEVGCSFVAVNLAVSLANVGVNTLLVDGNLRQPAVHKYFDIPADARGLTECLMAPADEPVSDFTQQGVLPGLDVMTAGHIGPTSHELLAGDRFADLISACLRDYDMTIIDTPPANGSADALRISTVAGFSLLVARKNRTLVSDMKLLAEQIRREGARAIGSVMNIP